MSYSDFKGYIYTYVDLLYYTNLVFVLFCICCSWKAVKPSDNDIYSFNKIGINTNIREVIKIKQFTVIHIVIFFLIQSTDVTECWTNDNFVYPYSIVYWWINVQIITNTDLFICLLHPVDLKGIFFKMTK